MLSDWLYFIRCLSSFSYINYRVRLYAVFDAIFSSANEIFSMNHLLMYLFVFGL